MAPPSFVGSPAVRATTSRLGPEAGGGSGQGVGEPPRAAQLQPDIRVPVGLRPLPTPHLAPGRPGAASRPGARPPAPSSREPSVCPRPASQRAAPARPALTLHVVQLGPLLLQFALEVFGLAFQRRQRLVLVQPVRGHLRAGKRQGGKRRTGMRVSCPRRIQRPRAQLQPPSPRSRPRPPALTPAAASPLPAGLSRGHSAPSASRSRACGARQGAETRNRAPFSAAVFSARGKQRV